MKKEKQIAAVIVLILVAIAVLVMVFSPAEAHYWHDDHNHEHTHDVDDTDTDGCLCVTGGVSDSDLSRALSLAMTAGAHEMDYSTQDWQLSVTYAQQINEDEEGAYSAKIGKRWDKLGKALMHVTYVPEQGQDYGDWVIVGGTIRF